MMDGSGWFWFVLKRLLKSARADDAVETFVGR